MKNAVIYARHIGYRTYEKTVDEQIVAAQEFAKASGYEVVGIYSDDYPTKQPRYAQYEQMLSDEKKSDWRTIIVYGAFQLGRNSDKTIRLMRYLHHKGKELIFVPQGDNNLNRFLKLLEALI